MYFELEKYLINQGFVPFINGMKEGYTEISSCDYAPHNCIGHVYQKREDLVNGEINPNKFRVTIGINEGVNMTVIFPRSKKDIDGFCKDGIYNRILSKEPSKMLEILQKLYLKL